MLQAYEEKLARLIKETEDYKSDSPPDQVRVNKPALIKAYIAKINSLEPTENVNQPVDQNHAGHISDLKTEVSELKKNQEKHGHGHVQDSMVNSIEDAHRPESSRISYNNEPEPPNEPQGLYYDNVLRNPRPKIQMLANLAEIESDGDDHSRNGVEEMVGPVLHRDEMPNSLKELEERIIKQAVHKKKTADIEQQKVLGQLEELRQHQENTNAEFRADAEKFLGETAQKKLSNKELSTSDTITLTVAVVAVICAMVFIVFTTMQ